MDNYECSIKALKIPFFSLGLHFPAGDVLDAVSEGLDHWNFGNWDLFRIWNLGFGY